MSSKLTDITNHLIELDFCPRENIDAWVDICTVINESQSRGHYIELCLQIRLESETE